METCGQAVVKKTDYLDSVPEDLHIIWNAIS